jgi:phospholipid/cholesterol/gamma-HCH transport system substrate-binding protein
MGQLMNNDSLYNHLDSVSVNLDRLLIDFKEHPKRYVHFSIFGRKDKN